MRSLGGFLRNLSFWFPSACIAALRLRQLAHQGFCRCRPSLLSRCESVATVQRRRGTHLLARPMIDLSVGVARVSSGHPRWRSISISPLVSGCARNARSRPRSGRRTRRSTCSIASDGAGNGSWRSAGRSPWSLSGTVRLGVLHDGIEAAATTVLADFMTTHPEARIEVVVDTGQALIDAMEAGKLDQAIAFQVNTRHAGPRTDALDRQPAAESHRRAPVAACDAGGAVRLPPGGCCSA